MLTIDLGDHLDRFVQEQVAQGRYRDAAEVVRAGLALLEERGTEPGKSLVKLGAEDQVEHLAELKRQINAAFDDPTPGRPLADVFDELELLSRADATGTKEQVGGHGA